MDFIKLLKKILMIRGIFCSILIIMNFKAFAMEIEKKSQIADDLTSFLPKELKLELAKFLGEAYCQELKNIESNNREDVISFCMDKRSIKNASFRCHLSFYNFRHLTPWIIDYINKNLSSLLKSALYKDKEFSKFLIIKSLKQYIGNDGAYRWFDLFLYSILCQLPDVTKILLHYLSDMVFINPFRYDPKYENKFYLIWNWINCLKSENIREYVKEQGFSGISKLDREVLHVQLSKCQKIIHDHFKNHEEYNIKPNLKNFTDSVYDERKCQARGNTVGDFCIFGASYFSLLIVIGILNDIVTTPQKYKQNWIDFKHKIKTNKKKIITSILGIFGLGLCSYGINKIIKSKDHNLGYRLA